MEDIKNFKTRDLIRSLIRKLLEQSIKTINELDFKEITIKEITKNRIQKIEQKLIKEGSCEKKAKKIAYKKGLIINFDKEYIKAYINLREILDKYYIMSPEVQSSDAKAKKIVKELYKEFIDNDKILPLNIQKQIDFNKTNKERIIADYIASMTDKYAQELFKDLTSIDSYYHY